MQVRDSSVPSSALTGTRRRKGSMSAQVRRRLLAWAAEYETDAFLDGDPSWFMHQVGGWQDQEVMAFIASCLSYGSRKAFMPKIRMILDASGQEPYQWMLDGSYRSLFRDDGRCFYRLYTNGMMLGFLDALREMLLGYGSIKAYVSQGVGRMAAIDAVARLCAWFSSRGVSGIVPKDTTSSCKRLCMFLRWMVRSGSPVDIGIWSDIIDRRTLIIPLDTHVLAVANGLGLITSRTGSMATALRLTKSLAEVFSEDPVRGDFALFGYGIYAKGNQNARS